MGRTYDDYRIEIETLDKKIAITEDIQKKIELIDEDIVLNEGYIRVLKRPIPVKIVFCVILSFAFLLGLIIFLPQIIVRSTKIKICRKRIAALQELRVSLL